MPFSADIAEESNNQASLDSFSMHSLDLLHNFPMPFSADTVEESNNQASLDSFSMHRCDWLHIRILLLRELMLCRK